MNITIRDFQLPDVFNGLLEVYKEVWYITEISTASLSNYLSNNNHMIVAEYENKIIGTLTLHLQYKLIRNGGISAFIEDVAVLEQYRNKGIGEKMVNYAKEKAEKLECYKVALSCFPERVRFYEKCGFFVENNTLRYNIK